LSELDAEPIAVEGAFRAELTALPAGQRRAALEAHLRAQVATVLRCDPERIAASAPLQQAGLDSLTAMEFRNRLEVSLGLTLNVTLIWRHPTLVDLTTHVLSALGLAEPAPIAPAPVIDRTDKLAQLLRAAKRLSDA
jgi:aryl carrier-like protein